MAGDHKCPVCQATFTRPQHVARHMRSHTGDRPYKCQYCGDQFARSDLLARHINKCHANEKPLPNTVTGGRRKGSAAGSRATTSKQACDQCVQSSLPCDGSNPCSKCVSRKCRCTYVKFHRQTAPSGPGHHPPRSPSSESPLSSRLPSHLDEFILAPPPISVPSLSSNLDHAYNTPFTFNPAAPAYPQTWTASDVPHLPFSIASDTDMTAKYRAQAEFLRRTGPSILSSSSALAPSTYVTQTHQTPSSNWYPAWGESGAYPLDDAKSYDGIARTHSLASSGLPAFSPEVYGPGLIGSAYRPRRVSLDLSDSSSATSQSVPSSATSSNVHLPLPEMYEPSEEMQNQTHGVHVLHQRRGSIPTSLPPPFSGLPESSGPPQQPLRVGEGGVSSAFGLMTIDDPNMLPSLSDASFFSSLVGELSHSPNATPMPMRAQHQHAHAHLGRDRGMSLSALPTPRATKEASDARELKDMWRTYMRSPLSGSAGTTGGLEGPMVSTSQPPLVSQTQMPHSPSSQRRRVRVSSLPSVTPTMEKGPWIMHGGAGGGGGSAVRTAGHDDLKSYEAAVNARNASLKLNLVPRRKGGVAPSLSASASVGAGQEDYVDQQGISRPSSSSSSSSLAQAFTVPTSQHPSTHSYHHTGQGHQHQTHNHSLQGHGHEPTHTHAHTPMSVMGLVKPPPMQGASISLPIPPSMSGAHSHSHSHSHSHPVPFGSASSTSLPLDAHSASSRESSVASDGSHGSPHTGTGGSGSDSEVLSSCSWSRPTFKRGPSQTLGPASSKRALVERPGSGPKGVKRDKCREDGVEGRVKDGEAMDANASMGSPGSRPMVGLPERAKRG